MPRFLLLLALLCVRLPGATPPPAPGPVTFEFTVAASEVRNPFAREIWARLIRPSGQPIVLPAYYAGDDVFAVHARPDEVGVYRLDSVAETTRGSAATPLEFKPRGAREAANATRIRLPAILRDPKNPAAFVREDGRPFIPVGTNLAWPEGECVPYYTSALSSFARANLTWMRVWMVHWGQLNLDWLPAWFGASPPPGGLDPRVAANWDQLIAAAHTHGVYLQIVFQHHGQLTTGANANWADNPWNAARPGGFLKAPTDFFTSPEARLLTKLKYRYIVARWGWAPAVFAWELFNEVHWVDTIDREKNEAVVAAWHDEMAAFVRAVDPYGHLVTTSAQNLRSPVFAQMDFYQPHLYAADMVAAARTYAGLPAPARPVFYGEVGDDHLPITPAAKEAGLAILPPVWASLMGTGSLPAQPWEGYRLLNAHRLDELGAVHRFLALNNFPKQNRLGLQPFSAVVESATRVPLEIAGVQMWQRQAPPDFTLPLDGRTPLEAADLPRIYVGWPGSIADGFPDRATIHLDFPRATTLRARIAGAGAGPAALQFLIDGRVAAEQAWPAPTAGAPRAPWPQVVEIPMPAGPHTLLVRNPGNTDWVDLAAIDLGLDTAVLAAIGKRHDSFIALWVWHRTNLYATGALTPATGTIVVDDVPAGTWTITWWDTAKGIPAPSSNIIHPGGPLRIATPSITRHAAVILTR